LLLVYGAQFVVFTYGRGAVRAALDEGARAGIAGRGRADEVARCETRARAAVDQMLGPRMRSGVRIRCDATDLDVTASAQVRFRGWVAPSLGGWKVDDWSFTTSATALLDPDPSRR
jgi:NAD(P)-dependent dehydrogenase (short-subunit alcohol dehydrogenase family)